MAGWLRQIGVGSQTRLGRCKHFSRLLIPMDEFILLKRTYPISTSDRECDAYKFLMANTTEQQRLEWGVDSSQLKTIIKENEKYIYQVGKDNGQFKTFASCFENYAIIRKFIFGIADEL
jgi:hypothetical protein